MDEWPFDLITPSRDHWRLAGVAIGGGVSVAGYSESSRTDGGGLWVGEQTFKLAGRAKIKAARALEGILDGGVTRMVIYSYEAPFAPEGAAGESVPHSDGTPFSDDTEYFQAPDGATLTADAALRATTLSIVMTAGELEGGEHFSITHAVKGVRRYKVIRVYDGSIVIRPPLREAAPTGAGLNFLKVGCVCKLANPDEFMAALDVDTGGASFTTATAVWIEAP